MALRKRSSKKMNRMAGLNGRGDLANVLAHQSMGSADSIEANLDKFEADVAARPLAANVAIAYDLLRAAKGPEVPRPRGRPKVVQPPSHVLLTRQQRRYRDRMLSKATEAWDKATGGTGIVLVNGKPVDQGKGGETP